MSLEGLQGYVLQVLAWLVLSTTTNFIALNWSAARGCTARVRSGSSDFPRGSVDSHAAAPPPIAPLSAEGVARAWRSNEPCQFAGR